jgi:hypothetical protein
VNRLKTIGMGVLGVLAITVGGGSTLWLLTMLHQWLLPWSSLAILAAPR